jgi:P-type Mg2+ transporter
VLSAPSAAGLSSAEAAVRLQQYGANAIDTTPSISLLRALGNRIRNPLVLVLIVAAAISAVTGDTASFLVIMVIVAASIVLDVMQEHRAGNAAASLRQRVSLISNVMRDGTTIECPAAQLVPGDVVLLSAGDLVPADGTLITARDLYVNEAALTGESYPAEKRAGVDDRAGRLLMGSSVISGTAAFILTATGRNAQLGNIASSLRRPPPPTAFAMGIRDFGRMIMWLTMLLVLFTLLINLMFKRPPLESFLFATALAVGLTPELLPMIVSVTLAHGAIRLSRKEVIVKQLSAIHDLGSMDILCSDKTGTLTEARIVLKAQVDATGMPVDDVLKLARLNAAFETGLKSPLDQAIVAGGECDISGWRKLDEVPFDFERRRVSILAESEEQRLLIVKGAPEDILALATHYQCQGRIETMDAEIHRKALDTLTDLGKKGLRTLAVAWRSVGSACAHASLSDEQDLVLAGFLGFLDPPKAGAREALADLGSLGVKVKILTGDGEGVTRSVCAALNLPEGGLLTGGDIAAMSDEALAARLADVTLFCRITPSQKLRVISALRRQGHVVGYLGDGINDAPSLHEADVSFSVDTAVDVAREAANLILLRKDLTILAEGVREGRRTYANIMKYVLMGASSNFGNMFSMAGGSLLLPFLPMLPIQVLLNNLLYDFSEIAIPMDYVDASMLDRPRRWNMSIIRNFMFLLGPISSVFDFLTFFVLLRLLGANERLFHTGWFVESIATQVLVIFIIRTADPLRSHPHPLLAATSLGVVGIAFALPYLPTASLLGFSPLPLPVLAAILAITLAYLVLVYFTRRMLVAHRLLE